MHKHSAARVQAVRNEFAALHKIFGDFRILVVVDINADSQFLGPESDTAREVMLTIRLLLQEDTWPQSFRRERGAVRPLRRLSPLNPGSPTSLATSYAPWTGELPENVWPSV